MAGSRSSSSSLPISIGNCKVEVEGNNFISRSNRNNLQISVSSAANVKISVDDSRKYSTRKCNNGLLRSRSREKVGGEGDFFAGDCSFLLINPKDTESKILLQEAINIYTKELPTMNYAANTGKESLFIEKCVSNGKYCTLLLKSNSIEGFQGVIAAVTYQIIPADTQYAEIPLAAVSSTYQHKGIGHLLYVELRQRMQNVGIRTIFCWGDKESEGFWLKQGFVSIAEVDSKGRVRKLPIKAEIRRALCFPGGSTLMVSHLNEDMNVPVNPSESSKFHIPLNPPVSSSLSHFNVQGLGSIEECYNIAKVTTKAKNPTGPKSKVLVGNRDSTDSKIMDGSPNHNLIHDCTALVPCNGADSDNKTTGLGASETVDVTDDMYCSCSARGLKRRICEASLSSLKSKRVKSCHHICGQLDSNLDSVCEYGQRNNSFHGDLSLAICRNKSLMGVTPQDPLTGIAASHAEQTRPVQVPSNDWIDEEFNTKGECFRIMLMNIADDAKKASLTKIIEDLGGSVTSDGSVSTHVVTGKARRTMNFCIALSSGAWILSPNWLKACFKEGKFVGEFSFILKDEDYVLKYRSELKDAVLRAKANPRALLKGYNICLATHVQPPLDTLSSIVRLAGGNVLHSLDKVREPSRTIFVACEEDMEEALLAIKRRVWTFSSDWFMNCIMRQELDMEAPQFAESL